MNIVSGMRPTGRLHLGHYLGVLKNWLELQDKYNSYFFVADWHALSTKYDEGLNLNELSIELVKDWLSVGIDENKSTIFIQSSVKYHSELYLILNMITPVNWLERNPTYKDMLNQKEMKDKNNAGFLTYPVLQTADIILYDAELVPIGEDQEPHLELAREIVRRFHFLFKTEIFKEPKSLLTDTARLPGVDGRKMSKSFGNAIYLSSTEDEVLKIMKKAKTDTNRIKKTDPGNPDVCIVYEYHKKFSSNEEVEFIATECRAGKIGCVDCKKICAKNINEFLNPIREKRASLNDEYIKDIINEGNKKANQKAKEKMEKVNQLIFN